jgi:hypothetical protein
MGRKAKLKKLRKMLREQTNNVKLKNIKKDYKNHNVSTVVDAPTLEATPEGKYRISGFEKRVVQKEIVENVSGAHKAYKMMKRMYDNPDYVMKLNALPSQEDEENLMKEILNKETPVSDTADNSEEETNG